MDSNTEQLIINNIMSLDYNPTVVVSTHRTNHLIRTDKIAVLNNYPKDVVGAGDSLLILSALSLFT